MQTRFPFYNEHIRKSIISFGTLFKNIVIVRKDVQKKTRQIIKVPLSYGPKEKYISRARDDAPDLNKDIMGVATRMSFEITGFQYDVERKLNSINRINTIAEGVGKYRQYTPVPYNIGFQVNLMSKIQDDALQVVEQILPFFQPSFNLTVDLVNSIGEKRDIPVVLENQLDNIVTGKQIGRAHV